MAAPVPPGWGKCRRCPGMFHEALLSKADLCPQCASNEVVSNSLAPSNMPGPAESSGTRSTARATAVNDFRGAMIDLLRSQSSTVGGSQTTPTAARNEAVSKFGPYTPKTNFISGASRVVKRSSKSSDATSSMAKKAKNGSVPVPKILPTYTFTATYLFGFRASDGPNEKDRIDVYPQPDEAVKKRLRLLHCLNRPFVIQQGELLQELKTFAFETFRTASRLTYELAKQNMKTAVQQGDIEAKSFSELKMETALSESRSSDYELAFVILSHSPGPSKSSHVQFNVTLSAEQIMQQHQQLLDQRGELGSKKPMDAFLKTKKNIGTNRSTFYVTAYCRNNPPLGDNHAFDGQEIEWDVPEDEDLESLDIEFIKTGYHSFTSVAMSPNVGLVYQPPATARAPSMKPIATIVSDDSDDEFAANMEWAMTESMKLSGSVLLSDSTVTLDDDDDNVTRTDGQLPEIHISHQAYLDESFVIDDALQVCETIRVGEGKRLNGNFDPTVKRELKGAGRGLTSDEVVSLVHDLSEDNDPVKRSQFFVTPILQTNDQNKAIDCYSHVVAKEMQDFHETKFALPRLWTQTAKRHTTEKFKTEYFSKMEQMSLIVQGSLLAYALVHEKECSMFPNISEAVLLSLCGAPDTLFTKTMVYEMGFQNAFRRSETEELIMDYHSEVIELIDRYNELAGKEGFPIFKLPCEYEDVANLTTPKVFETFVILSECKWRRLLGLSYIKTGFIQWFPRHEVLLPLLPFIPNFFKTVHSFEDFRKQFKEPNGTDSEELRITFAAYMRLAKTWKPVFWTHVLRFVSGQMHIPVKTKISLNIVLNGGSGVYEARTCFAKLDLSPWKTEWNDVEQKTDEIMFWEALVTPSDDEAARNKELSFSSV